MQESFDQAPKDGKGVKTVEIILPPKEGVRGYEQQLPASFFEAADPLKTIEINTDAGVIAIPGNMLSKNDIEDAADISLKIAEADKSKLGADLQAQIGDRPVIELSLTVAGESVSWSSPASKVTVSVPYKPTAAELQDPEHITIWYLDGSGKPVCIPSGRYKPATGMVTFTTSHFSNYAVVYVNKTFTDLSGYAWASREISVLASKGIINGVGENSYGPAANITRADFLSLLVRTLGLNAAVDGNFGDVSPKDYYYNELGIAKKLGVTIGIGNIRFNPNPPMTRQDMMVMAAKAMKIAGILEATENSAVLNSFADKTAIASYAVGSIAELVDAWLVIGSNNRINPLGNATRAEIAVLMYRIYNAE